ncbi:hypothetical protein EZV62_000365 [Acer yangbiense]|uniref:Uncharacterized protein n=1 Tax=Acer yangbiense TaxID=1000413 RepID=A0A5C7ITS8_9ROSI|nr:hypothetical protein EZV62_000365 [Acer yangbiense]
MIIKMIITHELNNENGGGGRLISKESSNRFFSSRKEDQEESSSSIDGFGLEGKSEKSQYLTPRQKAGKESVFFNDKFEKVDVEVGVSEKIKEENLMEETAAEKEKAKDIETEMSVSAPAAAHAEKKNLQNDEKVF